MQVPSDVIAAFPNSMRSFGNCSWCFSPTCSTRYSICVYLVVFGDVPYQLSSTCAMSSLYCSTFVFWLGGATSRRLCAAFVESCCITAMYVVIIFCNSSFFSCPIMPKSMSPRVLFCISIMFPGCMSAWNVPRSKNCCVAASVSLYAIVFLCCVVNFFVSDNFFPSRYSIVSIFFVVYLWCTFGIFIV